MLLLRTLNASRRFLKNFQFRSPLHSFSVESNMNHVLKNLCQILSCSEQKALSVYQTFPKVRSVTDLSRIEQNIKLLTDNGVSKDSIGDNPFLLCLEIDVLQRKLATIKQMRPRQIDDFIPLLEITQPVLREVATKMAIEHEEGVIPEKNRIYYLSKELQIAPATVSKYCSKFNSIFFASFTRIKKKLNILLDYNVDGEQILQSLYVFQCADKVFISRLEELFSNGLYDIKLWFFKCTDDKFHKLLVSEKKNAKEIPIELEHKINRRNLEKFTILNDLNMMLSCDDKVSAEIYYNYIHIIDQIATAKTNIGILTDHEVGLEFIRSNAVVLTLPNAQINDNIKLVKEMNPNSIEDFLPLIEVETSKLEIFTRKVTDLQNKVPHPILYFSKKLNISPTTVSKYFAKHNQLFFKEFIGLKMKLDLLVSYNVQPMSILKSPHTLNSNVETLESRLNSRKSEGIENISSWMLVCDTTRMKTVSARRVEEKNLFGETENTVDYEAKRLNWDETAKAKAIKYYPPLAKCSVKKVKAHLDYLLNETHFTTEDINSNVSVFRSNLDELQLRMNELASVGLIPGKLYYICLDRKRYLEMVGKFCMCKNCPDTLEKFGLIEKRIKNKFYNLTP